MQNYILNTSIEYLKGIGPAKAELLKSELNIHTFGDLLTFYPFRYADRSKITPISAVNGNLPDVQIKGKITRIDTSGVGRTTRFHAWIKDDTGMLELVWFQGVKWVKDKIVPGREYVAYGKPNYFKGTLNIAHPEMETLQEFTATFHTGLQGIYHSTEKLKNKGLHTKGIARLQANLSTILNEKLHENLSEGIIKFFQFISHQQALHQIHFPENENSLNAAKARLKFEEFFFMQLQIQQIKYLRNLEIKGHKFESVGKYFNDFFHRNLPFSLTNAQKRVIREIRIDTGSGHQMNRLLQGDVGSGKTLVALMSMLLAIDNGYQAAIMAPTEILATQHLQTITKLTQGLGLNITLLTGSTKTAARKDIHENLEAGSTDIIIGTHALIEKNVKFYNLGLVVIDEQHRFGVEQRSKLWQKNTIPPHILVMTATPIPRTLAMSLYGDLDNSIIDELPPGRKPIKTFHFYDHNRMEINRFLRNQINEGRQIYIVYPLIEESKKSDLKDLMDGFDTITREFPMPEYQVSIVHGRMKPKDKAFEMERFAKGQTNILVATTVIEVGVDVPNATVMVIENAERFGLSQLHQLRGRVGRGGNQSYCLLVSKDELSSDAKTRINTMVQTNDGFIIAQADLKIRGPGDLQGTQQSGVMDLKLASITDDEPILKYANAVALKTITDDPNLKEPHNTPMAKYLDYLTQSGAIWSRIS